MKLHIKRDQRDKKGLLGGHKGVGFLLSCRVQISPEERQMIDRYKAIETPLTYRTASDGSQIPSVTVANLLNGVQYELSDVTTLLQNENVIKSACKDFKTLLEVMQTFGGEEVVEF